MATAIKVRAPFDKQKELVTLCGGKAVGLNGDVPAHSDASKASPGAQKVVPAATQAQLRELYEQGNPLLYEAEAETKQEKDK